MDDIFEEIQQQNQSCCDGLEIEMAFMVSGNFHVRGIGIEAHHQDAPVFISSAQLRALADAIDKT
jgi:hypothetical protein